MLQKLQKCCKNPHFVAKTLKNAKMLQNVAKCCGLLQS